MDRRNFLGRLLGFTASLPFLAKLETEEWQRIILPYRMMFRDSGHYIQAPGVANIDFNGQKAVFQAETLDVKSTLALDRCLLMTEKGQVISELPFNVGGVTCVNGDKFKCTATLNTSMFIPTLEEFIDFYVRYKR